jgi:hypothetical protein
LYTADNNGDNAIGLGELLRVVQFYNAGTFGCEPGSEDGYAPSDSDRNCCPHDSDYSEGPDWTINLSELLRAIQFFSTGAYSYCPEGGTEDIYCPGLQ